MKRILALVLGLMAAPGVAQEGDMLDYTPPVLETWRYISDQVMGGVSEGQAEIAGPEGALHLRLTGTVSTANRGGFIQVRGDLVTPLPEGAQGVVVRVKGNGEGYFIHLRTRGTVLPWQYYQAPFPSGPEWQELRVPFAAFRASGAMLRDVPRAGDIKSLAAVAYGRDYEADLSFRWIGVY
jgi:hypothetical protein